MEGHENSQFASGRNEGEEGISNFEGTNEELEETPPPPYQEDPDEIVQVVYQQSESNGSFVGVESSLISRVGYGEECRSSSSTSQARNQTTSGYYPQDASIEAGEQHLMTRSSSTLAPVTEESISGMATHYNEAPRVSCEQPDGPVEFPSGYGENEELEAEELSAHGQMANSYEPSYGEDTNAKLFYSNAQTTEATPLYSTVKKNLPAHEPPSDHYHINPEPVYENGSSLVEYGAGNQVEPENDQELKATANDQESLAGTEETKAAEEEQEDHDDEADVDLSYLLARQKQGVAESGSFRNNFKKKLALSSSSATENDLNAHRQKLLESQEMANDGGGAMVPASGAGDNGGHDFKRTHSVSFTSGAGRGNRHSVDIRNLPSYLTHKRASIVDVAKGAMSSILSSLGGGGGSTASANRRDSKESQHDEEPIFEEPLAPTLSLGQRVALVRNSGTEFGTVGWIGQLPEVDYDWVVGVVFDNMIGDCDGAHNGVRYFYARENYAMFVPLSTLIKTDNYIGRPETGTMLSRMSVSLKPGQLISVQRSSILLQHCFLNAPHQRVGHDVRAVSNRLHCQCHNCGPCAHLTKQGSRLNHLPAFGGHHAPNKKNSLAHAAVEILAHHHHHYHEEEHKEADDYQFGDNAAHACNYVRYSCCKQEGASGHDFKSDCEMVRPELLDNLIHAPRAPISKTRIKRNTGSRAGHNQQKHLQLMTNESTLDSTIKQTSPLNSDSDEDENESAFSSSSGSNQSLNSQGDADSAHRYPDFRFEQDTIFSQRNVYSTIDSKMSIIDQQRFIHRSESDAFSHLNDHYFERSKSLGSTIRHCFACILGRKDGGSKPKKRRMSARDRMLEYRRRQSTFVPSTLAKPQEDFFSHGLPFPGNQTSPTSEANSDCSNS